MLIAELVAAPDDFRRARGLRSQSYLNALAGQYTEASSDLTDAIVLNRTTQQPNSEIRNRLLLAMMLGERNQPRAATVQLDSAYAVLQRSDIEATMVFWVGKALVRSGDARRATVLLERLERTTRADSPLDRAALSGLRGELLLGRRDTASVALLRQALEANHSAVLEESVARAAMVSGRFEEAAAMYDRLATTSQFGTEGQHLGRFAVYWLGRVREQEGKPAMARAAYERFLSGWAQPDTTLYSVIDARARLEQLRRGGRGG
jgi:tetratricopeptide (TPR) repeat protein